MPMEAVPPAGYHTVTPRMVVSDLTGAVQFLRAAFDATGDVIAVRPAEIRIGETLVMVTPAGARDLFPAFFYVYRRRPRLSPCTRCRCSEPRRAARHTVRRPAS